jgi:hypothetical protein
MFLYVLLVLFDKMVGEDRPTLRQGLLSGPVLVPVMLDTGQGLRGGGIDLHG